MQKVNRALLDKTYFPLNDMDFRNFARLLDAPTESNPALEKLLTKPTRWDTPHKASGKASKK